MLRNKTAVKAGIVGALAVAYLGYGVFTGISMDAKLDALNEKAASGQPPAELQEAYEMVNAESKKYPEFFIGKGMTPHDFLQRSDLSEKMKSYQETIELERKNTSDDYFYQSYAYPWLQDENRDISAASDAVLINDMRHYSAFYTEQMKMFNTAKQHCSGEHKIVDLVKESSEDVGTQLVYVALNAEQNLCPKL